MGRDEFRTLTPWSFFLPMALAVTLGVLVANALGAALFGDEPAGPSGDLAEAVTAANGDASTAAGAPARTAAATKQPAPPQAGALPALEPVSLPGPSSARRDGGVRACIGGTVAVRAENGWEQEVVNNAPARCVASSR